MPPRAPDRLSRKAAGLVSAEENCPQCGQPMLRAWGATCGLCRPPTGHARSSDLVAAARPGQGSLTLGWLVVVDSPDEGKEGAVLALDNPVVVLTRQGAVAGVPGEIALRDDFLSAGHATVTCMPAGAEVQFTLQDRREPGPSANGTFLNGRRLAVGENGALCDGDEIRVGSTELVFRNLFVPAGSR
jgi:FHA domain